MFLISAVIEDCRNLLRSILSLKFGSELKHTPSHRSRFDRLILIVGTGIDRSKIKAPPIGQDAIDITGKPEDEARSNLLQLPSQDRPLPVTTLRRNNTYSHTMDSKWELLVDDAFSENTLKQVLIDADHRSEIFDISPQLCTICETLDFSELESFPIRTLMKIEQNAQDNCELCSMIYKKAQLAGYQSEDPITLSDVAGRLLLNGKESAALRVCCHYGKLPVPRWSVQLEN